MGPRSALLKESPVPGDHPDRSRLTWHATSPPWLEGSSYRSNPPGRLLPGLATRLSPDPRVEALSHNELTSEVVPTAADSTLSASPGLPGHRTRIRRGNGTIKPPWPACPLQAPTPAGSALARPSAVRRSASGSSRSVPSVWSWSSLRTGRPLSRSVLTRRRPRSPPPSTDDGGWSWETFDLEGEDFLAPRQIHWLGSFDNAPAVRPTPPPGATGRSGHLPRSGLDSARVRSALGRASRFPGRAEPEGRR